MKTKDFEQLHALLVLNDYSQLSKGAEILFKMLRGKIIGHYKKQFKFKHGVAEDLAQEALIKIMKKVHTVEEPKAFHGWCWKLVTNHGLDYTRKVKTEKIDYDTDFLEERRDLQMKIEVTDNMDQRNCIREMTEKFKEEYPDHHYALSLHVEGYSHEDIGVMLRKKRTQGATKEFISQCRKKIHLFLKRCDEMN